MLLISKKAETKPKPGNMGKVINYNMRKHKIFNAVGMIVPPPPIPFNYIMALPYGICICETYSFSFSRKNRFS